MKKAYLGDGVYVEIVDGMPGTLKLETDRCGEIHWLILEPEVYAALVNYYEATVEASHERVTD